MNKNLLKITILFVLTIGIVYFKYNDFAYKSYERSILNNNIEAFIAAQESYRSEFKSYNLNSTEVRKMLSFADEVAGYVNIDEVPEALKDKVMNEQKPYLNKDSYRVLVLINSRKYNKIALWVVDSSGNKKEIYSETDYHQSTVKH